MKYTIQFKEKSSNGEMIIFIVLRSGNERVKISTHLTSPVKFEGKEFPKSVSNHKTRTFLLEKLCNDIEEYILLHPDATVHEVKEAVTGKKNKGQSTLSTYIMQFGQQQRKVSTCLLYKATSDKVMLFDAKATFQSAGVEWLKKFEQYCLDNVGLSINGTAKELRNIRATFNWAIDNDLTEKYPFRKFKIRHEKTRKRSLTVEQLRELKDYPVDAWQEEYRDVFMLIFYLIGINISDLLELQGLKDGRCVYHRNKTGRLYDIAVPPEAMAIIERYRGDRHLIRPLDYAGSVNGYTRRLNDGLKSIGESHKAVQRDADGNVIRRRDGRAKWHIERKPIHPEISTYWARHTWASIAASLDIPKETISKALGHADEKTADIYIDFDMRKIDEANRRVIDWVLYCKK